MMKNMRLRSKIGFIIMVFVGGLIFAYYVASFYRQPKVQIVLTGDHIWKDADGGAIACNLIEETEEHNETYLYTDELKLKPGIYEIGVDYVSVGNENRIVVGYDDLGLYSVLCDEVILNDYQQAKQFYIWVNDAQEHLRLVVRNNGYGAVQINQIYVRTAWNSALYKSFKLFIGILTVAIFAGVLVFRPKGGYNHIIPVGIGMITVLASLGTCTEYMLPGHDLYFHLLRIEGIKGALLEGQFPVRMQQNWCYGWGYPVSIMYGDLTLLFPAVLRILGMPVQTAYKCFIWSINAGTALVSYYAFSKIAKNKYIGLAGSAVYTLSVYRLCCIYIRAAFGEYSAMMFLPLVILTFWYAFGEEPGDAEYGKKWLAPVLGFSGLIQTHILTCLMIAMFIILLCIIMIKKIWNRKTFFYLVRIAVLTILVNIWFLVPFFQYFRENLNANAVSVIWDFQRLGITWAELISPTFSGYLGRGWSEIRSVAFKSSISLGTTYIIIWLLAIIIYNYANSKKMKANLLIGILLGGLTAFMATNLFPYHFLNQKVPKLAMWISKPALPYRYLSLTGLFLAVLLLFVLIVIEEKWGKSALAVVTGLLVCLAAYQGSEYIYRVMLNGSIVLLYDDETLDKGDLIGGEYLYVGSQTWTTYIEHSPRGGDIEIENWEKINGGYSVTCSNALEQAWIDIPMFYYIGYTAYDKEDKNIKFDIMKGDNNRILFAVPMGYEGTIIVRFEEPLLWRITEGFSLLVLISCIICSIGQYIKKRRSVREESLTEESISSCNPV